MSDQINAGMGMDSGGFSQGLNSAKESAAKFIAFLARVEGVFEQVRTGSKSVAEGIAMIGGVSAAVKADLEMLAAGEMTLQQVMSGMAGAGAAEKATIQALLLGNTQLEQSLDALGVKWDRDTKKIEVNLAAREKMLAVFNEMKASSWRSAGLVDPSGKPTARVKSPEAFMGTDPMGFDSASDIKIARILQRMRRTADRAGLKEFKLPGIEMGEGKANLNMARLAMSMEQLKEKIKETTEAEKALEAAEESHYKKHKANLNEAIRLREKMHTIQRKQQMEAQKQHRQASFAAMDAMFIKGPGKTRARELQTQGIISLGRELKKTEGTANKMFRKFEQGTALATKGALGMARGIQNANSQMALLTSSFAGLLAMAGGVTAGAFFKMAMDFDKSMARVNLLVKQGESDLATLTEQVKEISRQFGASPMNTAEGFRLAISSDVPPGEVMKFMKEAGKLSVMSNASIEKTTDLLAMLRNAFNLSTNDLGRLRDMIFVMTDRGRVEVEQFASEIGKIAPTARLAGVNIQEMMAAFAGLSRTRSTEQAGTLLRNLFKNIIDPSEQAKKAIHEFGLGLTPAAVKANGLMQTIRNFREQLQKNPKILNQVSEDLRELAAWGDLTDSQFNALISTFDEMTNSVGLADQKFQEMAKTSSVTWDRLMSQVKISATDMGMSLLGMFDSWTKGSQGVELMQKRIEQGFKRIELGIRYFMAAVQFVGVMAGVVLGGVGTAISVIWGLLKGIVNFAERGLAKLDVRSKTAELQEVQEQIKKLSDEGFGAGAKEMQPLLQRERELNDALQESLQGLDASEANIEQTIKDTIENVKASWKPTQVMAEAFGENAKKANELAHEIADLDLVIKNMTADAKASAGFQEGMTNRLKSAAELARDQTAKLKEWATETLKNQVLQGYETLNQWIKDNRDAIKGAIAANREWAREQHRAAQEAIRDLERLQEQRDKFNDSVLQSIDKLKDQDRTPEEQMAARLARGQDLERLANSALRAGNMDRAEELVQQAMTAYESMLDVVGGNTKGNREKVIGAMERLMGQMNQVFGTEEGSLQAKIEAATKAEQQFTLHAKEAEERLKKFEQGVVDVARAIKDLGTAPTDEALMKVKDMILKLVGETGWFEKFTADPALQAMDKVIEKAQALKEIMGTVPDELIMKLQGSGLLDLLRGTTGFVPIEPAGTTNNETTQNITNVDSIHVSAGGGEGGPKKADARRLARDIKRHIERGESPALTRRK